MGGWADRNNSKPPVLTPPEDNCRFDDMDGNVGDKDRLFVKEPGPDNSFGRDLNAAGGGVWVMRKNRQGIAMRFLTKDMVAPCVLNGDSFTSDPPTTAGWLSATAESNGQGASYCDMAKSFSPQRLVLNIELCGSSAAPIPVRNVSPRPRFQYRLFRWVLEV
jgi:hypothetical protein